MQQGCHDLKQCFAQPCVEMAEFICAHIPHVDMVRMVNSGTEAVMSAVRVARGFTGKNKIRFKEGGTYRWIIREK